MFSLGLIIGFSAYEEYESQDNEVSTEYVELPQGIEIIEHKRVHGTDQYTITGSIKNNSSWVWQSVRLNALITADNAQVNSCSSGKGKVSNLQINEVRLFTITCRGVAGSGLPSNINYSVYVSSGRRIVGT